MRPRSRRTCSGSRGSARSSGRGRGGTGRCTCACGRTSRSSRRSGASWRGAWTDVGAPLFQSSSMFAAGAGSVIDLLAPKGLWLLGLLAPLIVLYILKIKRARRVVASTWLWATAQRDLMARSPFKKLILQVPLILQAIVLLALGFALSRPATRGREITGDHVAIVIDASASMATLSSAGAASGPAGAPTTRMDLARAVAEDIVAGLPP